MFKISNSTGQVTINRFPRTVRKKPNASFSFFIENSTPNSTKESNKSILSKYIKLKERFARKFKPVNQELLKEAGITNYAPVYPNGARGEALSSRKNRRFLKTVKDAGIDTIIDLRDKYTSKAYPNLCKQNKLRYYNIPIDSSDIDDKEIIKSLPLLFRLLNKGNYYIACAQGLHRTDIALSINYIFNPKASDIPVLKGHLRENTLKSDDIIRRINSIKKQLTPSEIKKLGWGKDFEETFKQRKENLINYNLLFVNKQ